MSRRSICNYDCECLTEKDMLVPLTNPQQNTNLQELLMQSVHNTNVETKKEHFQKFADLIGNQFRHGGDKYKLPGFEDREATDVISAVFGGESQFDWILGTMMKYLFRFKNFQREKDLLKVATYCYILWLKQGNHLKTNHDEDTKSKPELDCRQG